MRRLRLYEIKVEVSNPVSKGTAVLDVYVVDEICKIPNVEVSFYSHLTVRIFILLQLSYLFVYKF